MRPIIAVIAAELAVQSCLGADPNITAPANQPNILFILTDDQDTVLGGDSAEAMPVGLPAMSDV